MTDIKKFIEEAGGSVEEGPVELSDGSGFMVASFPLPEDHWSTAAGHDNPPMPLRCGTDNPFREELEKAAKSAARYAYRAATMNGTADMDPDALVQNFVTGLIGYYTPDGLSSLESWMNPEPVPLEVGSISRNYHEE